MRRSSLRSCYQRRPRLVLAVPLLTLALGCEDGARAGAPGPAADDERPRLEAQVVLTPLQPAAGGDFVAAVTYSASPATSNLGAYEVEIHFDPELAQFVAPDSGITSGRVVNTSGAAAGAIVVAGAKSDGFSDRLLFKGTFKALAAGAGPADFDVVLREAVDGRLVDLLAQSR